MDPVAARSAAERYVADLILECQAIADLFEVGWGSSVSGGCRTGEATSTEGDKSTAPGKTVRQPVKEKRDLVATQLDPDKLTAWLQGAHLPSGVQKSESPFMAALMSTPAVKPRVPASPDKSTSPPMSPASDDTATGSPNPRPKASARPASAGGSCLSSTSGASAFFWGDGSGEWSARLGVQRMARGATERNQFFDGDKPTLTGDSRESETHRLRRLLDPRFRRWPGQDIGVSSNIGGSPREPVPPQKAPQRPGRRSNPYTTIPDESHSQPASASGGKNRPARPSTAPPVRRQATNSKKGPSMAPPGSQDSTQAAAVAGVRSSAIGFSFNQLQVGKKDNSSKSVGDVFEKWMQEQEALRQRADDWLRLKLWKNDEPRDEYVQQVYRVEDDLRNMFRREKRFTIAEHKHATSSNPKAIDSQRISVHGLRRLAQDLQMSMEDVFLVKEVFESFDSDGGGTLDVKEFDGAVGKLLWLQLGEEATTERIESLTGWHWWDSDVDKTGTINFREFLSWYAGNAFNEEMMLSGPTRQLRKIAKAYGVTADYVEQMKADFDFCDTDQSGEVEFEEFHQILHRCMKVPPQHWVPPSRVQYFWNLIDADGSGKITFTEFFEWWLKYFDDRCFESTQKAEPAPFEAFYKHVRRMGPGFIDPPPYSHNEIEQYRAMLEAETIDEQDRVAQEIFGQITDNSYRRGATLKI